MKPGGAAFTLTVRGTNLVPRATVIWDGVARPTTFVSSTTITAAIPASDVAIAGTVTVSVVTPPPGGGSASLPFVVENPFPGLTAITPITDEATEVHQMFWTTPSWVKPLAPLGRHLMRIFLDQDRVVVIRQREGLMTAPKVMLINDADTQARWWMHVKDEWANASKEGRPFQNPLKARTLRWMS